jgi:hypothetical protein
MCPNLKLLVHDGNSSLQHRIFLAGERMISSHRLREMWHVIAGSEAFEIWTWAEYLFIDSDRINRK